MTEEIKAGILISSSDWKSANEIELKENIIYLVREADHSERDYRDYRLARYAGKLETRWNGPQDALWVNGENGPKSPYRYHFCELTFEK